jgi:hypothetical protein
MATDKKTHGFRFYRAGGFDQVRLETADDLRHLGELDQKLWVALACPVQGVVFDQRTLGFVDTDGDGRIRVPEVIAATSWACAALKDPALLLKGGSSLALDAIDTSKDEGKHLLSSARRILDNLGKKDAKAISVEDTTDTSKVFAASRWNGDGVVPPKAAEDADLEKLITELIACVGGEDDRSGEKGVTQEKVDAFWKEAEAHVAWWKKAEDDAANVLPLGDGTAAAADALRAVKAKVDDYYTRCQLAAFDARAAAALNRDEAEYKALAGDVLTAERDAIAALPLAHVEAGRPMPLGVGVNPAWAARIAAFRAAAVVPLLGERESLTAADYQALVAKLAPYEAFQGGKEGALVESLGKERLRAIVLSDAKAKLEGLIREDKALEPEALAIASVDKLVHLNRDLVRLLFNFVSFQDFYSRKRKAIFQAGTLYLDGRSCELCVEVADAAAHGGVATLSGAFLVYCDLTRKGSTDKKTIVAAMTGGDAEALRVGRNGLFYDRDGDDWDAAVVKIVEHPISVRQAFWMPYKRVGRLINEQIEKFASSRDKEMQDKTAANVADTGAQAAAPGTPTPPPDGFDVARFAGIFAAIGLAIGAIGSVLAAVLTGFLSLAWWQMPLVVVGVILLISCPAMLLAWLKLRRRNLGPILDATGWAVNARAKLNIPFGASLTGVAALPEGAERTMEDPFEEKKSPLRWLIPLLLLVGLGYGAYHYGYIASWKKALTAPSPAAAPSGAPSAGAAPAAP